MSFHAQPKIEIWYFLKGERFASRTKYFVPRAGEEVRFNSAWYCVKQVFWIEDEEYERAHVELTPLQQDSSK